MNLFNLIAKITLDDKEYKKGIDSAKKEGTSFGQKIATGAKVAGKALAAMYTGVVAVGVALAKLTLGSIKHADAILDEAQKLNMSTDAYQKWALLLKMSGTNIDAMSTGMRTFTGILNHASQGQSDALITLSRLGLGYEDFADLSVEETLKLVVEQFQDMEEGTEKTRLAIDLFGRSGQELLPLLNSQRGSIDELFTSYEDLGLILSEDVIKQSDVLDNKMTLLTEKFKILGTDLGLTFLPIVDQVVEGLMGLATGSEEAGETLTTAIGGALDTIIDYLPQLAEFASRIIPILVDTVLSSLPKLLEAALAIVYSLAEMLWEYLPELIPAAIQMILTLVEALLENLDILVEAALAIVLAIAFGLIDSLPIIIEMAPKILEALSTGLLDSFAVIGGAIVTVMTKIGETMLGNVSKIVNQVPEIYNKIKTKFQNMDWKQLGKDILEGVKNGILDGVSAVVDAAKSAAQSIFDSVKGFFGIKSPSVLMAEEVGRYIPEGIALGVEDYAPEANRDIRDTLKASTDAPQIVGGMMSAMQIVGMGGANQPSTQNIVIKIGEREIKDYIVTSVDEALRSRGLRNLNRIARY